MVENGRKNIFKDKQTRNKIPMMFYMLKCFRKDNNWVFRFCQKTSKVESSYLAFINVKISTKKSQQQLSES